MLVCVRSIPFWSKDTKYVYRHYATLFFIFAVDESESELGILDLVQVFVETLDRCFESVCELDLIFNSDKVRSCVCLRGHGVITMNDVLAFVAGALHSGRDRSRYAQRDCCWARCRVPALCGCWCLRLCECVS
jgi:hypothetical protein